MTQYKPRLWFLLRRGVRLAVACSTAGGSLALPNGALAADATAIPPGRVTG